MTTFRQIVYMVLDELKLLHDDAYYTEEHIIFLATRIRALLLKRKYENTAQKTVSKSNYQELCFDLEKVDLLPDACGGGGWLRSNIKLPKLMHGIGEVMAYPVNFILSEYFTFIPIERMSYVGRNKWLQNIIYCAIGTDDYVYLKSMNPQFKYLQKMHLNAVFETPEDAAEYLCSNTDCECNKHCDKIDLPFPLEEDLVAPCIELIVQELIGSRYAPKDTNNNAEDDLSELNDRSSSPKPVAYNTSGLS